MPTAKNLRPLTEKERQVVAENHALAHGLVRRHYRLPTSHATASYDDVVSEAYLGLARAVQLHDPKRGALSTIAYVRMRQTASRYLDCHSRPVRIPVHQIYKWRAEQREAQGRGENPEGSRGVQMLYQRFAPVCEETIVDSQQPVLDALAEADAAAFDTERLHQAIARLPEQQGAAIALRLGLYSNAGMRTLRQVGYAMGIGRESAGQLCRKAIASLRRQLADEVAA